MAKIEYWDLAPELIEYIRGVLEKNAQPYDDAELQEASDELYDDWPEVQKRKKYKDLIGASAEDDGRYGIIPAPMAGEQQYLLFGDATWNGQEELFVGSADGDEKGNPITDYFVDASYDDSKFELTLTRGDQTTLVLSIGDLFSEHGSADMPGELVIETKKRYRGMPGILTIKRKKSDTDMPGSITIKMLEDSKDMPGSIAIKMKEGSKDMPGSLVIGDKTGSKDLPGSIAVIITIKNDNADMPGVLTVTAPKPQNAYKDMPGVINIIQNETPSQDYGYSDGAIILSDNYSKDVCDIKGYCPNYHVLWSHVYTLDSNAARYPEEQYWHGMIVPNVNRKILRDEDSIPNTFYLNFLTTMDHMFQYMRKVETIDLNELDCTGHWHTENIKDMTGMFEYCESVTSLDLSMFNLSKVTSMENMFQCCYALESIKLPKYPAGTGSAKAGSMFNFCKNLRSIDLTEFSTANLYHMGSMFARCEKLEEIIGVIDCASITQPYSQLSSMFTQTTNLQKVTFVNMPYDTVNHLTEDGLREHLGLKFATNVEIEVHYRDGSVKYW